MTKKKSFGIGKELDTAFNETIQAVDLYSQIGRLEIIPLDKIEIDPNNPRILRFLPTHACRLRDKTQGNLEEINDDDILSVIDKPSLDDGIRDEIDSLLSLSRSIQEQGVLNPIIVYSFGDKYRIAAGERRYLSSILANKNNIQARISEEKPSEVILRKIQWAENIEREGLSLWEKINNLQLITNATNPSEKFTPKELAATLGCCLRRAYDYHAVLYADNEVKEMVKAGKLGNIKKCALIARVSDKQVKNLVISQYKDELNYNQLAQMIDNIKATVQRDKNKLKKPKKGAQRRIGLGYVLNPQVAKYVIERILSDDENISFDRKEYAAINWNSFHEVSEAFKKLLRILEKEYSPKEV